MTHTYVSTDKEVGGVKCTLDTQVPCDSISFRVFLRWGTEKIDGKGKKGKEKGRDEWERRNKK